MKSQTSKVTCVSRSIYSRCLLHFSQENSKDRISLSETLGVSYMVSQPKSVIQKRSLEIEVPSYVGIREQAVMAMEEGGGRQIARER